MLKWLLRLWGLVYYIVPRTPRRALLQALCFCQVQLAYTHAAHPDVVDDDMFFSCVAVTPALVSCIVNAARNTGCSTFSSIGCGSGFLEWFLALEVGERVHVVEVGEPRKHSVFPFVRSMLIVEIVKCRSVVATVPATNALVISWGTGVRWERYLETYNGPLVIFIHPHDLYDFSEACVFRLFPSTMTQPFHDVFMFIRQQ